MNCLGIDFGTKRIGLAISINNIVWPLKTIINNDHVFQKIIEVIDENSIEKIYVGMCQGEMVNNINAFIDKLKDMIKLPIETVEEAVSTIEAEKIYLKNKNKKKEYKQKIDALAAAVILNRVIS